MVFVVRTIKLIDHKSPDQLMTLAVIPTALY